MSLWVWLRDLDPRIWQAFVGGFFIAAGWVFNGWQNRREAKRLRHERLRDTHRALFAEIAANLSNLLDEASLDEAGSETIRRMVADADYIPFVPRERNDRLFETIKAEINILPRVTIDAIVNYYTQIDMIAAFVEDMRGAGFRRLSSERRILMYQDYVEMQKTALYLGRVANDLIAVYSKQGKDAAERAVNAYSLN